MDRPPPTAAPINDDNYKSKLFGLRATAISHFDFYERRILLGELAKEMSTAIWELLNSWQRRNILERALLYDPTPSCPVWSYKWDVSKCTCSAINDAWACALCEEQLASEPRTIRWSDVRDAPSLARYEYHLVRGPWSTLYSEAKGKKPVWEDYLTEEEEDDWLQGTYTFSWRLLCAEFVMGERLEFRAIRRMHKRLKGRDYFKLNGPATAREPSPPEAFEFTE